MDGVALGLPIVEVAANQDRARHRRLLIIQSPHVSRPSNRLAPFLRIAQNISI
jgi:hypothetical protein